MASGTANGSINPNVPYITAGIIVLSSPFVFSAKHKMTKAIRVYNNGLRQTGNNERKAEYYLSVSRSSVGLTVKF